VLRLRHIHPGGVTCFLFFEGMLGVATVLALTGLVTWWAVLVLPLCVAAMVKLNDLVAGALAPSPAPRNRVAVRDEESVRRAAASRSDAPPPVRRGTSDRAIADRKVADRPPPAKSAPTDPRKASRPPVAERPAASSPAESPKSGGGAARGAGRRPAAATPRAIEAAGAPPAKAADPADPADQDLTAPAKPSAPRRRPAAPREPAGAADADRKHSEAAAEEPNEAVPPQPDALVDFLTDIQDDGVPLSPDATPATDVDADSDAEEEPDPRHTGGAHSPPHSADPAQQSAQRRARRSSRAGREKHG
jgi:hypothetical protein